MSLKIKTKILKQVSSPHPYYIANEQRYIMCWGICKLWTGLAIATGMVE